MSGKQKLYFLLNRIADAREITPSGQPLIIDPTNDLNRKYQDIELQQLFAKLENDEKVLRVLKIPSRVKMIDIVKDLDPYDHADDGCWHIELLPAFDNYYWQIQQEPEYQEYTGKVPANRPQGAGSSTLMSYEEKLDLIVKALVEAKKATGKDGRTMLFLNATNGLDKLDEQEVRAILGKLEDEEILRIEQIINRLLPASRQPVNPGYILITIRTGFDDWYGNYLLKQKSKPENMDWLNLLKVLDVSVDIDQQLQITGNTLVAIPTFPYPYIGRFLELFPVDTIGTRKSYQQHRWEGAQFLLRQGVATNVELQSGDILGYGNIEIRVNVAKFYEFLKAIQAEYRKRTETDKEEDGQTAKKPLKIDHEEKKSKVSYDERVGELDIDGKKVKLNRDSFRAKLLELLLKSDKNRQKEWSWDEVIEEIEDTKDMEATKENKGRFYPACDGLSKHIALKTGVTDLLNYNKSTVQINPKYL